MLEICYILFGYYRMGDRSVDISIYSVINIIKIKQVCETYFS